MWESFGRAAAWIAVLVVTVRLQIALEQWVGIYNACALYGFLILVVVAVAAWRVTIGGIR